MSIKMSIPDKSQLGQNNTSDTKHRYKLNNINKEPLHSIPQKQVGTTGARGTELPPPFFNFLFTYLFLIKISLFPYYFISFSLF